MGCHVRISPMDTPLHACTKAMQNHSGYSEGNFELKVRSASYKPYLCKVCTLNIRCIRPQVIVFAIYIRRAIARELSWDHRLNVRRSSRTSAATMTPSGRFNDGKAMT